MSLIVYSLTPYNLIVAILRIARPRRPTLPVRLMEDLQDLNALDLYFKDRKLISVSVVASGDYSLVYRTLSVQLLRGIKANSSEAAAALRLWAGFLKMRTRTVRFVATRLLVGVINEFVSMIYDPTTSFELPETLVQLVKGLWAQLLTSCWKDVNIHQRTMFAREIASWVVMCPHVFWNEETSQIFADGLMDNQESVRNEYMRQARKIAFHMKTGILGSNPTQIWSDILMIYVEHTRVAGSMSRRTALELLSQFNRPNLRSSWCIRILRSCIEMEEPPATVSHAIRLVWNEEEANLASLLVDLQDTTSSDGKAASLIGQALQQTRPNHAWDELANALALHDMHSSHIDFIVQILIHLAKRVADTKVCDLVHDIIRSYPAQLKWAPQLLQKIDNLNEYYYVLVGKLIDLKVEETALILETWALKDLDDEKQRILEKFRYSGIPIYLAGWINVGPQYSLAAKATALLRPSSPSELRARFDNLIQDLHQNIQLDELKIIVRCLTRLYSSLKLLGGHAKSEYVQFDGSAIYQAIRALSAPLSDSEQQLLLNIHLLEKLNALYPSSISVNDLFPGLFHRSNIVFLAGGASI